MSNTTFGVVIKYNRSPRGMAKSWRAYSRMAIEQTLVYWWQAILPKHFKMSAFAEYGYEQRKASYVKRKMRKVHHRLPNVYTGKMREEMTGKMPDIKAKPQEGRAKFRGLPRYVYMSTHRYLTVGHGKKKRVVMIRTPDKQKEIAATSREDFRALITKHKKTQTKLLTEHSDSRPAVA